MNKSAVLQIFVDAGFREHTGSTSGGIKGRAGLGIWIPAIGTGVSLSAASMDNNESESLAILLGVVIGKIMNLSNSVILTDSRVNCDRIAGNSPLLGVLSIVKNSLVARGVSLEWRPREITSLADFFASMALDGKSLIAVAANAKNPADKFRPLLHLQQKDKIPLKDATVKWLTNASPSKSFAEFVKAGLNEVVPDILSMLGQEIPTAEFQLLTEHFYARAQKALHRS
jgi:hypothetical protein